MAQLAEIKEKVSSIIDNVLQLDGAVTITDETSFFGNEESAGLIQDSLAILEIASRLAEEYGILPSDLDEASFQNLQTLSEMIYSKVAENSLAAA
ncbi:Acyl carrier protein [Pseudarcicella hirudinis]|uniref:Acyl carrier protein n=1 Tax=Pseudarcicella hirudinis TaxID=1079859 RepID=A0A1I5THC2_9BACT|nr:acyl carrier protein [Pseudarcicella hirudinis]SFP82318.1 Acyl carrier protein [Pseudarcicella hirudinis]